MESVHLGDTSSHDTAPEHPYMPQNKHYVKNQDRDIAARNESYVKPNTM